MNDSKVFILYADLAEKIGNMPREEKGALLEAILCYLNGAALPDDMPFSAELAFNFLRPSIDHGAEKSKARSNAAAKRWEKDNATAIQTDAKQCKAMQTDANGCKADAKRCSIKNKKQEIKNKKQEHIEIPNGISCAEPETASAPEADDLPFGEPEPDFMPEPIPDPVFITLPLVGNDSHEITETEVDEYKALYPAVDVEQELRNMRGWLMDNPTRRKTKRGIAAFVGNWLRKEQDRGKSAGGYTAPRSVPGRVDFQAWAEKMEAQERAKKEAAANGF